MSENKAFLKEQIITYLGNKRALLDFLEIAICECKKELKKEKISFLDMFSGSGIVSRFAKKHSSFILANDLEDYSEIINLCYLSNKNKSLDEQIDYYYNKLTSNLSPKKGFIRELYAPKDELVIKENDRVFYTIKNATYIDTIRQNIEKFVPKELKQYFLAPLIYEASVHSNTSGVFKGFYKDKNGIGKFGGSGENALGRIKGEISLKKPIFSNFKSDFEVLKLEANKLALKCDYIDICYLDPPYNQHPYGSNYFMLNLIANYKKPKEISKISGIPKDWNRSNFNKAAFAESSLLEIIHNIKAKFVLISYNCEGFVKKESFLKKLKKIGKVKLKEQKYNTFRGSRNLQNRPIHINEQLYILKKY